MNFEIQRDGAVTVIRLSSPATFAMIEEAIAEVDQLEDSELELWDLSNPGLTLPTEYVKQLSRLARDKVHRPRKTAILAFDTLSYGVSRMYSAYREQSDNETRVFTSEAAAREWLHEPD